MLFKKRDQPEEEVEVEEVVLNFYPIVRLKPHPSRGFIKTDITPPLEILQDLFFGEDDEVRKNAEERLKEWFKEEGYGGGVWKIEIYAPESKTPLKTKTIKILDEPVKYGIDRWVVYVKSPRSGRFYRAEGVEYDHYPSHEELLEDIGGGGIIKLVGYSGNKKMTEHRIKIDAPEPQWLLEKDDSFHSELIKTLEERKKKALEEVLSDVKGDKLTKLNKEIDEIKEMIMEEKLKELRELIESLKNKKEEIGKEESKTNFFDLMFTKPYEIKLELSKELIKGYIDRGDLETAKQLLMETLPDGASALVSLITGLGQLANVSATYLQRKMERESWKIEQREKKEEKSSEKREESERQEEDVLFKEADIDIKVEEFEGGYRIKLGGVEA